MFRFNPCKPCCKSVCKICGNLALPKFWNITFDGAGIDTSYINSIDDGKDICSGLFSPVVVAFESTYPKPCRWTGFSSTIYKVCGYGGCTNGNCICDCDVCFNVLVNPVRRNGAGCDNIVSGGGWAKLQRILGGCTWSSVDTPYNRTGHELTLTMSVNPDIPVTLVLRDTSAVPYRTATYECDSRSCQDTMTFNYISQTDPPGEPNIWPPQIKAYKANCNSLYQLCLCDGCNTDWSVDLPNLELLPSFLDEIAPAKPLTDTNTVWEGGEMVLSNAGLVMRDADWGENPPYAPCSRSGTNGSTQTSIPNPPGLSIPWQSKPYLRAAVGMAADVRIGPIYANRRIAVLSLSVWTRKLPITPPVFGWQEPIISRETVQYYIEDIDSATSDCNDYESKQFSIFRGNPMRHSSANPCGIITHSPYIFFYSAYRGSYSGPGIDDYIVSWPDTITVRKVASSPATPCPPNPTGLITTTINPSLPVNTDTSYQRTDDSTTTITISADHEKIRATVKVVYINRCKNPSSAIVVSDTKQYSLPLADFDCLGPNELTLDSSTTGNVCNNWPTKLTMTP